MIIQEILQNIVGKKYSVNKWYCFRTIYEQNKKRYPASVSEDIWHNCVKTGIVGINPPFFMYAIRFAATNVPAPGQ